MTGNYPKRPELHRSNDGTNKMDVTSECMLQLVIFFIYDISIGKRRTSPCHFHYISHTFHKLVDGCHWSIQEEIRF